MWLQTWRYRSHLFCSVLLGSLSLPSFFFFWFVWLLLRFFCTLNVHNPCHLPTSTAIFCKLVCYYHQAILDSALSIWHRISELMTFTATVQHLQIWKWTAWGIYPVNRAVNHQIFISQICLVKGVASFLLQVPHVSLFPWQKTVKLLLVGCVWSSVATVASRSLQ